MMLKIAVFTRNAESERENRDAGEHRIAPEASQCVPEVLQQIIYPAEAPHVPALLFRECHVAHLPAALFLCGVDWAFFTRSGFLQLKVKSQFFG